MRFLIPVIIGFVTGIISSMLGHGILRWERWVFLVICMAIYFIIENKLVK